MILRTDFRKTSALCRLSCRDLIPSFPLCVLFRLDCSQVRVGCLRLPSFHDRKINITILFGHDDIAREITAIILFQSQKLKQAYYIIYYIFGRFRIKKKATSRLIWYFSHPFGDGYTPVLSYNIMKQIQALNMYDMSA